MPSPLDNLGLWRQLQEQGPALATSLELCWAKAEKLLRHAAATHPYHTSHGPDHAMALIGILEQALTPLHLELRPAELYILLGATLLHDIGMVGEVDTSQTSASRHREGHHLRSQHYVLRHASEMSLLPEYAESIADVAASHRRISIAKYVKDRVARNERPRVRLCAALLRMADECHITADRVPEDYAVLGLPEVSTRHFISHLHTHGPLFDEPTGRITFDVRVDTVAMEKLAHAARDKMQIELEELVPVFEEYHVPYRTVCFELERGTLVRRKVIDCLLLRGRSTIPEIAAETNESESEIDRCTELTEEIVPSTARPGAKGASIELVISGETFLTLARECLSDRSEPNRALLFVRSQLARETLTDDYLDGLVGREGPASVPRRTLCRIMRSFPTALWFAIESAPNLPSKQMTGAGALWNHLMGAVEEDFIRSPELLLEPGLVDEICDEGRRNRDEWARWKVQQIVMYHRAFNLEEVVEQWVFPSKWERAAQPVPPHADFQAEMSFKFDSAGQFTNPAETIAAGNRLGLGYQFEQAEGVQFECTIRNLSTRKEFEGANVHIVRMDPSGAHDVRSGWVPGDIEMGTEGGTYVLKPQWENDRSKLDWSLPFACFFHLKPQAGTHTSEHNTIAMYGSLTLDRSLLNCRKASMLVEAVEQDGTRWMLAAPPGHPTEYVEIQADLHSVLPSSLRTDFKAAVQTLASIESFLGIDIPYPHWGLPAEIECFLASEAPSSAEEARHLLARTNDAMGKHERPLLSSIHVEVYRDAQVESRQHLATYPGYRYPGIKVTPDEGDVRDFESRFQAAMGNPEEQIRVTNTIKLSPRAAIAYLEGNKQPLREEEWIHPGVLGQIRSGSPVEYRSVAEALWQPVEECTWYKVCPFLLRLRELTAAERWLEEARYFETDTEDRHRGYLAAREAYRAEGANPIACHVLGWAAYRVGQLDEAERITNRAYTLGKGEIRGVASFNMGLFFLHRRANSPDVSHVDVEGAVEWYVRGLDSLDGLGADAKGRVLSGAVVDLDEFRDSLEDAADAISEVLWRLQSDELSLHQAKVQLRRAVE